MQSLYPFYSSRGFRDMWHRGHSRNRDADPKCRTRFRFLVRQKGSALCPYPERAAPLFETVVGIRQDAVRVYPCRSSLILLIRGAPSFSRIRAIPAYLSAKNTKRAVLLSEHGPHEIRGREDLFGRRRRINAPAQLLVDHIQPHFAAFHHIQLVQNIADVFLFFDLLVHEPH